MDILTNSFAGFSAIVFAENKKKYIFAVRF